MESYLILGSAYAFAAAVQPGQFQAYLISQAITHGWRRALPAAFAPLLSDAPIVCLTVLVLTRVPTTLVHVLQLAGGVFLLYLAVGAFQSCRKFSPELTLPPASMRRTLVKAALVNLLNPNPYLAWALIMGPLLLRAWREAPARGVALLAAFYGTMVLSCAAIMVLFAMARSLGPRVARWLVAVSGVALAGFAVYQLWSGANGVVNQRNNPVQQTACFVGSTQK